MPELVANGPTIPVRLMNDLDDERAVFFCGAGISRGRESRLPGFLGLVKHIYKTNHLSPDAVERDALDCDEENPERRKPKLDKVLDLLERPERLGPSDLRRCVMDRLSKPQRGPLVTHRALIDLSRTQKGLRIVTTNFDNRFAEAGADEKMVDTAPKLPWPKRHNWSSIVHLHGRILAGSDGADLVLTAADFGRAYLTEQWAARFVTELFREFTIVFIGYSLDDPVMGYMVDALAAERSKGARFGAAYAFAAHDGAAASKERARNAWRAKNVEPILYDEQDDHRLLRDTLTEWARIRNHPFRARTQIALNEMSKLPGGPNDPVVERVTWAVRVPDAARALAEAPPVVDEGDFPKVEQWLDRFEEAGLLSRPAAGENGTDGPPVRLGDGDRHEGNPPDTDAVSSYLAQWMTRHLHVPQVLAWVLRKGGYMHPVLRNMGQKALANPAAEIPPRLRHLWTVLATHDLADYDRFLWLPEHLEQSASTEEARRIEEQVIRSIAPRLVVLAGPSLRRKFEQALDEEPRAIPGVEDCGHLELSIGDKDHFHEIQQVLEDPSFLSQNAMTLTSYLEDAFTLLKDSETAYEDSLSYRPSIAPHSQNHDRDDWTHLIDLVRDSYFALFENDRARAGNLLDRWVLSKQPLFKRLALHALTDNTKSDIRIARQLLVTGRKPGLWKCEIRREVLRFLRLAGGRLPRDLRVDVVRAIHAGSKSKPANPSEGYDKMIWEEKVLRLHKLAVSGAKLDKRSRALANEREAGGIDEDRDEFPSWHEFRWTDSAEDAPYKLVEGTIDDVAHALSGGEIDEWRFRGLVKLQPTKVTAALHQLAERGVWPERYWKQFLWLVPGQSEEEVARLLGRAPDDLFSGVDSAAASFVNGLAEKYGIDQEAELRTLWEKAWEGAPEAVVRSDDPFDRALSSAAGRLAEAALARLWKYEPTVCGALPLPVRPYFDKIATDPKGHWGRIRLARRLYDLFGIDPGWTREHLIPRLDPAHPAEEAHVLWAAYAQSRKVGPDLLAAFRDSFLRILKSVERVSHHRDGLVGLFVVVCLEAPNELAEKETRDVVDSFSDEALQTVLDSLKQHLNGNAEDRARIWQCVIDPWLEHYWPKEGARNTTETSEAMLRLLLECGDAFPMAVERFSDRVKPVAGRRLYALKNSQHVSRHPDSVFRLLKHVVGPASFQHGHKHFVRKLLEDLEQASPVLGEDREFQKMYRQATS